jgi:hypothetical protein
MGIKDRKEKFLSSLREKMDKNATLVRLLGILEERVMR